MNTDSTAGNRPILKRRAIWIATPLLALLLLGAMAAWQFGAYLHAPLSVPEAGIAFEIRPGKAFARISTDLADAGILDRPRWFSWYGRLTGNAGRVRAGEYWIEAGTTPASLLAKFVAGEVRLYSFTIVEGWTFRELVTALAGHPAIESSIVFEDWPALLEELGAEYDYPEGLFLPETYRFPKHTRDTEILRQAHALMKSALAEEWANRAAGLVLTTPYDALILASIIEKETALAEERPRISGVFNRRLERGMRLQTDPTVIYGVGAEFDGNLTRRHLRTDTPYNTYTRRGLPPTPIALPGRAAIHAALHPAPGNEVFFVATGLGDGSHKFSETKEQHDAAVREYLDRQRAARNRD